MVIKDNIIFNEAKKIQDQSPEFISWISENCFKYINDTYDVKHYDDYERPSLYTFNVDEYYIKIKPLYMFDDKSNWAISGYEININ